MNCATCETVFTPTRKWQRFCSLKCRRKYNTTLKPEALRRDLDAALAQVEQLRRELAVVQAQAASLPGLIRTELARLDKPTG